MRTVRETVPRQADSEVSGSGAPVPSGASLVVQSGFYEGLEFALDREWLVLGRGHSADLVIAEPTLSRVHAAVGYGAEGFFVEALGSTNETRLNGAKGERQELKDCDDLQIGNLSISVSLPD